MERESLPYPGLPTPRSARRGPEAATAAPFPARARQQHRPAHGPARHLPNPGGSRSPRPAHSPAPSSGPAAPLTPASEAKDQLWLPLRISSSDQGRSHTGVGSAASCGAPFICGRRTVSRGAGAAATPAPQPLARPGAHRDRRPRRCHPPPARRSAERRHVTRRPARPRPAPRSVRTGWARGSAGSGVWGGIVSLIAGEPRPRG